MIIWLVVSTNPFENYARQNGFIFPNFSGWKFQKKIFELPPASYFPTVNQEFWHAQNYNQPWPFSEIHCLNHLVEKWLLVFGLVHTFQVGSHLEKMGSLLIQSGWKSESQNWLVKNGILVIIL